MIMLAIPLLLSCAVVLLISTPGTAIHRWRAVASGWTKQAPRPTERPATAPTLRILVLASTALGVAIAVVMGGILGLLCGAMAASVAVLLLRRLEPRATRVRSEQLRVQAPIACDLLASVLASGADLLTACDAVSHAIDPPLGGQLGEVAARLRLAADPIDAFAPLRAFDPTAPIALAAMRAIDSGAPLADSLRRVANDLRLARRAELLAKARVLGVRAVLPLGLCFLPSFVLLGVVPVVASLIGQLLATVN